MTDRTTSGHDRARCVPHRAVNGGEQRSLSAKLMQPPTWGQAGSAGDLDDLLNRVAHAAAPLPVLGRWRSLRSGSACHRSHGVKAERNRGQVKITVPLVPVSEQSVVRTFVSGPWQGHLGEQVGELFRGVR
jgi:hypothetical protein